jgi:hypothetical protein
MRQFIAQGQQRAPRRQSGNCIKEMMMKNAIILGLMLAMAAAFGTMALAAGPYVAADPDATATACAAATPVAANETTLLAASTNNPPSVMVPKRLCAIVTNMSTSITARVGDAVSAASGIALNPVPAAQATGSAGGTTVLCVTNALLACGIGGTTTLSVTEINNTP